MRRLPLASHTIKLCVTKSLIIFFNYIKLNKNGGIMEFTLTEKAKIELNEIKNDNKPIKLKITGYS